MWHNLLYGSLGLEHAQGHSLAAYPLATCLDGSPARYYLRKGEPSQVFVYFEGTGFCGSLPDCYARSLTAQGSTLQDANTRQLDNVVFDLNPETNPVLASFTHVFVRYCDGGYFGGEQQAPIQFNGTNLHFRGRFITEAVMADLATHFQGASDIVLGGSSAGGVHILAHIDAMRAMVPSNSKARVVGFADSGFYLDLPIYTPQLSLLVSSTGHNATGLLNSGCLGEFSSSPEKCFLGQHVAKFIRTACFVWQSRFDEDQRAHSMTSKCAATSRCVEAYGRKVALTIHKTLLKSLFARHGVFIDACERHGGQGLPVPLQIAAAEDDSTPLTAFSKWHKRSVQVLWAQVATRYPCLGCCTGGNQEVNLNVGGSREELR